MQQNPINPTLFTRLAQTINSRYGSIIGSYKCCQLDTLPIPFQSKFKLYQLTDFGGIPTFHYRIAYSEGKTILLDGSLKSVNDIFAEEAPIINHSTVIDFLKFFVSHTCYPIDSNRIISSIEDIDFTEYPGEDLLLRITHNITPPIITFNNDYFTIYCNLIMDATFYQSAIDVYKNGRVEIVEKREILKDIPVGEMMHDF